MGACCSKNTINDKIVTIEKQPWSVVQKTLGTGDLLFLSGFEWVPQVTGRKKFFDEEHERWTYVGFVYLKGDTPYLIDLSFKDSKLRNLNGDFKSGEVKMVKAEDRVFRTVGGSENMYYKSAAIRHLRMYKQSKKDKQAIKKSLGSLFGNVINRDMRAIFQAHVANGEYNATVVDESEFFAAELVLRILEIYELVIKGKYNPLVLSIDDIEGMQEMQRGAFYSAKEPVDLSYGTGHSWTDLVVNYDPREPVDVHGEKQIDATKVSELMDTNNGEEILKVADEAASAAVELDKKAEYLQASEKYEKAIALYNQYVILDAYYRETETGPYLVGFNEVELKRAQGLLNKYRERFGIVSHPKHMTKEEKKQEVEVEEKSELKDWQKERNLGTADKLQHQADDLIENIGDKIGNLFRSKKKKSKWAEILGRQDSEEDGKEEDGKKPGDSNEPGKPKTIHVNPLLAKMRKKGLLKKKNVVVCY